MKGQSAVVKLVAVLAIFGATVASGASKVDVCHIPPGNPDNAHTINVSENAVPAHLAHGDTLGPCGVTETCAAQGGFCSGGCDPGAGEMEVEIPPGDCGGARCCVRVP